MSNKNLDLKFLSEIKFNVNYNYVFLLLNIRAKK